MKKHLVIIVSLMFILFGGQVLAKGTVMQVSTIDALVAGLYDGTVSCGQLLKHGDLGIGTFDRLEGEMVVLDGTVYQVKADGTVFKPGAEMTTPFAALCQFTKDKTILLGQGLDFKGVEAVIDESLPDKNLFHAIKIKGTFSYMKTRSVPAQIKPYPPLAEVTKKQALFEMHDITGTIVALRCPPYVQGINVPGYHMHFISEDRTQGGHIIDFLVDRGTCDIDTCNEFLLVLPTEGKDFQRVDLSKDRSKELNQIEK